MGWRDRVQALWEVNSRAYPLEFHLGWIAAESTDNTKVQVTKLKNGSTLTEVGWYQFDMPSDGDSLDITTQQIIDSEEESFKAGTRMMARNDAKVPQSISGNARLGLIKMWHTLPALAKILCDHFSTIDCSDWNDVSGWGRVNVTAAMIKGHDPEKDFRNVDKVLSELPDSDTYTVGERITDLVDKVGDALTSEDGSISTTTIVIAIAVGLAGAALIIWRTL